MIDIFPDSPATIKAGQQAKRPDHPFSKLEKRTAKDGGFIRRARSNASGSSAVVPRDEVLSELCVFVEQVASLNSTSN